MSKYHVLALDLDGTLTDSKKRVGSKSKEMIWKAIDDNVKVVLASGRPMLGIVNVADELQLDCRGGYILAYNGGVIMDYKSKKEVYKCVFPAELIHPVCAIARKYGLNPLSYNDRCIVAETDSDEYVRREAYNNSAEILVVKDLESYLDYPIVKMMVVGKPERIKEALSEFGKRFEGELSVFLSEPYFMEVAPAGIKKDRALDILVKKLGYDSNSVMACGDGLNDIPMIKYAGLGVAMGNAYAEVKEIADCVSLSNEEDGVAYAIEKYLL